MRFLGAESCDFAVVRALRSAGHDVLAVSDIAPRAEDPDVINLAVSENRILLTEDKDFGQLVYAHGLESIGVIFLRFPSHARKQIARDVVRMVKKEADKLIGSFVVVQPGRTRIGSKPGV
jgi:predicted nuclease of predicted toxin-antitoxin system